MLNLYFKKYGEPYEARALSSSPSKLSRSLLLLISVYLQGPCLHLSIVFVALEHRLRRTRASSQVYAYSPSPPYLGMFRLLCAVFSFSLSSSPSKLSCSLCSPSTLKLYVLHLAIVLSKVEHRVHRTRASSEVCASSPSPPHVGMFGLILYKYLIAFMYRTLSELNMARVSHI
ncbi:hypothetical protein AAZX31_15G183000 [Glycine max]